MFDQLINRMRGRGAVTGNDVCVVVPVYKPLTPSEMFAFERMCRVFAMRDFVVFAPPTLNDYIFDLSSKYQVKIELLNLPFERFLGISAYNRLMRGPCIYEKLINYEWMLICQTDVLVIKDDLDFWMLQGYANIGAPIFEDYARQKRLNIRSIGANGGVCLRHIPSCLSVLEQRKDFCITITDAWNMERRFLWKTYRCLKDWALFNSDSGFFETRMNEDMFWSYLVPRHFSWFKVPSPTEMAMFAYDANPRYVHAINGGRAPMAIHAWERYDKDFALGLLES